MLESVYRFDWNVFQFIEKYLYNPVFDIVVKIFSAIGEMGIIYMIMAISFMVFGLFTRNGKYKKAAMTLAFAIAFMEIINHFVVKLAFARLRPFDFDWSQYAWAGQFNFPEIIAKPDSLSFPSGHSTGAFAAAFSLNRFDKRWGICGYIFAVIMAFSRVYAHVHYCTDVIAGVFFGIIYGILGFLFVYLIYKFFDEKVFPPIEDMLEKIFKRNK